MLPIVIRPVPESKCSLLTDEVFVVDSFVVQPLWQNFVEQANCICSNSHGACNDSYVTPRFPFAHKKHPLFRHDSIVDHP